MRTENDPWSGLPKMEALEGRRLLSGWVEVWGPVVEGDRALFSEPGSQVPTADRAPAARAAAPMPKVRGVYKADIVLDKSGQRIALEIKIARQSGGRIEGAMLVGAMEMDAVGTVKSDKTFTFAWYDWPGVFCQVTGKFGARRSVTGRFRYVEGKHKLSGAVRPEIGV